MSKYKYRVLFISVLTILMFISTTQIIKSPPTTTCNLLLDTTLITFCWAAQGIVLQRIFVNKESK